MNDSIQILIRTAMKVLAGWLVSKALADQATADQVGNGLGAGLLVLFSFIWSKRHLTAAADAPKTPPSTGTKLPIALMLALCCLSLPFAGCQSTSSRIAYTTVATPAITVQQAMIAWGDYVAQYHPSAATEAKVKAAYLKYQAAELVAIDAAQAYVAVAGSTNSTPAAITQAATGQAAASALGDLINLLRQFGVKI